MISYITVSDIQTETNQPKTMIFKGINQEIFQFDLTYEDDATITGYIWQSEITRLRFHFQFLDLNVKSTILVSDIKKAIAWFENLGNNKPVPSKVTIFNGQIYFELIEHHNFPKLIQITYDSQERSTINGAYSPSNGAKASGFAIKKSLQCSMDELELLNTAKKLNTALQLELLKGERIESKKPRKES